MCATFSVPSLRADSPKNFILNFWEEKKDISGEGKKKTLVIYRPTLLEGDKKREIDLLSLSMVRW